MAEAVTLDLVRKAQLRRNDVVKLLNVPDLTTLLSGCFVRVLLEIESRGEDYRIGRVVSVDPGQAYSGFTHDATASTTMYLHLQLQGQLTGINGSHYQLNSISNSPITEHELNEWIAECPLDAVSVIEAGNKVRHVQTILRTGAVPRGPDSNASPPSSLAPSESTAFPAQRLGATVANGAGAAGAAAPAAGFNSTVQQPRGNGVAGPSGVSRDADFEMPTADQLRRLVIEECRTEKAVFPKDFAHLTGQQLRMVERELLDYLENVRDTIKNSQPTCVVCCDRLPTVITLPCKHKVLCRLCASQVTNCPVCRQTTVEMFEPQEL